ncbi:UNVERIFIED_ORG: hypothetical protein ABIC62_002738 [Burkholderia sp. 1595]|uniref:Uncharacterized protein n=1 Tax=Paraburkholderia terricola TaxID=169427 RepID=A0ABU1LUA8_9BURK|nr:hypothetical protein [Paraburkholderia terricola]MDR6481245.1 hypothetical protein [Paraburkholderia terricola]
MMDGRRVRTISAGEICLDASLAHASPAANALSASPAKR